MESSKESSELVAVLVIRIRRFEVLLKAQKTLKRPLNVDDLLKVQA